MVHVQGRGGGRFLLAARGGRRMAQGSLRVWIAAGLLVVAAGCTEPAKPPPAPPPPAPVSKDSCGADPLQYLVGRPHTDIPVPVNPSLRRVVCSSCVITQDFNPARQTIVYDSDTGLVRSVRCG